MLTAIVGYGYLTGYGDQAVIFDGVLDRLTVLRCQFAPSFFAPISSSIQVGAWSLARGPVADPAIDAGTAESWRQFCVEQQMIDAQSRILLPVLTEIIPEKV